MSNAHAPAHAHEAPAHGHDASPGHDAHDAHGHGDDHGHGSANNGKVVAAIVILALVLLAAKAGLVVPTAAGGRSIESTRRPTTSGGRGIVVLQDGRVFTGALRVDPATISIDTKDADGRETQVVVNRANAVRYFDADHDTLTEEYWTKYGSERLQAGYTRGASGGGIVVLTSGRVLVGRVTSDASNVTVRWPYGEQTFTGEVVVPRGEVRFLDPTHDALGDDYWRRYPDAPLDAAYRRAGTAPPRDDRSSSAQPVSPRTRAELAQTRGDWEHAATDWAAVYTESHATADLDNLLQCTGKFLDDQLQREDPDRAFNFVKDLLSPFSSVQIVRKNLGNLYQTAASFCLVRRGLPGKVEEAERWSETLRALGGEYVEVADGIKHAIDDVRKTDREEAEERAAGRPG
jgi:hypothetical protein